MSAALAGLRRHPGALAGAALLSLVLLPALLAPWLPLADPTLTEPAQRMLPPGAAGHPLGTDALGRDLLARLLWGARSSLAVGALATLAAALVGSVIGIAAGFFGRLTDLLLMRGVDVLMAFPYLLLALAIVAALGPGLEHAMLAIAVANVPFFARAVRGAALEIRHQDYVGAARLAGHRGLRLIGFEVLPNLAPTILLLMTTTLGWMVLETAGLSFLGLGAQPPDADLGSMLGDGREFLTTYPWVSLLPGLAILLLVAGINLLGDALRDLLDPRLAASGGADSTPGAGTAADEGERPDVPAARAGGSRSAPRSGSAPQPASAPADGASAPADGRVPALLAVEGLRVEVPSPAGAVAAVAALDLHLAAGERVALVGESGSGKSLTALALLRLTPRGTAVRGHIRLGDETVLQLAPEALRRLRGARIGYVPQDPFGALDPLFRVGDQLAEAVRAHGRPTAEAVAARVSELIAMVGLDPVAGIHRRFPHQLSGGQCQRVAIALALAQRPALLIADEATTALDVRVQAEVLRLLDRLSAEDGRALLFVSHDLAVVAGLCERVLVLYAGRVVEDGPLDRVLAAPAHPYTSALLACSPELGRPDKPLPAVAGQPPSPAEAARILPGCRFAPRCPKAQPVCRGAEPALAGVGERHWARCLFPEGRAAPAAGGGGRP